MDKESNGKPAVILIHGMWSNQDTLRDVKEAFVDQGYTAESLCLPYHFPKAEHTEASRAKLARTRVQDYVAFIVEQVKRLDSPPILVGHSMGALLAQLVAAQVPCDRLILLSSAPPAGINGLSWSAIRTLGRNLLRFPLWTSVTEVALANVEYGIANAQTSSVQKDIYESCTYESGMATFQISIGSLLGSRSATHVNTRSIECPVLIVGGTADRITPINIQRSIAQRFGKQASLVEIENCCHWTVGGAYFPEVRSRIFKWLQGH
ncbi:alpha/beta hydrolase [Marinobacter sp. 2_MG-2023]|uniref:alpha/beta hydrolase n=1 Tax=Marinobacter sp. 2_MG-2023 TaxID=3062679 RepID=UPI0026E3DEB8|nr:alpha/beta hydrolase [Marinobacter sp. 2_MG-2023]MDO6442229.1 alpha/beta hydrolase [Marinobacter sp. 2_MG-2023]